MTQSVASGFAFNGQMPIFYEDRGHKNAPPLLMLMGLGAPMTTWTEPFCQALIDCGFRIIKFDNRDVGLSGSSPKPPPNAALSLLKSRFKLPLNAPYNLETMADDAIHILEHLEIDKAHFLGASLGGTIAMLCAANYPHKVLSLNSVMATSIAAELPLPKLKILLYLSGISDVRIKDEKTAAKSRLRYYNLIKSPMYPTAKSVIATRAIVAYQRSFRPLASAYHSGALLETGSIEQQLSKIKAPTLLIHGDSDPFVHVSAAYNLKQHISHANLKIIHGMGHEIPDQLCTKFARLIQKNSKI